MDGTRKPEIWYWGFARSLVIIIERLPCEIMKISLLKLSRKKEVIKRIELSELAEMIRENPEKDEPNMS